MTGGSAAYMEFIIMRNAKAEMTHRVTRAGAARQSIQKEPQMQMWSKKSGRKVEKKYGFGSRLKCTLPLIVLKSSSVVLVVVVFTNTSNSPVFIGVDVVVVVVVGDVVEVVDEVVGVVCYWSPKVPTTSVVVGESVWRYERL